MGITRLSKKSSISKTSTRVAFGSGAVVGFCCCTYRFCCCTHRYIHIFKHVCGFCFLFFTCGLEAGDCGSLQTFCLLAQLPLFMHLWCVQLSVHSVVYKAAFIVYAPCVIISFTFSS